VTDTLSAKARMLAEGGLQKEQMRGVIREGREQVQHGAIRCLLVGALKFLCFFVSEFFGGGFLARS